MNRIMIAAVVMTVGDTVADFLNVLVFHGGMFGMTIATAVSAYLSLAVLLPHFAGKNAFFSCPSLSMDRHVIRAMTADGFPQAAMLGATVTGFRLYALCMVFYGMNVVFRSCCQGTGQIRNAYMLTVCDGFAAPLVMAPVLGSLFGVPVLWLCFALGKGITTAVMLLVFRKMNASVRGCDAVIPVPRHFGEDIEAALDCTVSEKEIAGDPDIASGGRILPAEQRWQTNGVSDQPHGRRSLQQYPEIRVL